MAVFGRLFGDQVGVHELGSISQATDVVALVRSRMPHTLAGEEMPVFEAAAFVGEWLRARIDAEWIAEGPFEPHIQAVHPSRAIVYLLPLVSILRTAATAGYDGIAALLDRVVDDVRATLGKDPLEALPIHPREERALVVAWIRKHRVVPGAMHTSLWRRCSTCSNVSEDSLTMELIGDDWEADAGVAAGILAQRAFQCPCGGIPGEIARFLMLRTKRGTVRFGDIYVGGNHTRVGCWTLLKDGRIEPCNSLALAP